MATMATRTVQPRTKTYEQNDILTNMRIKGDSKADAAILKATQKLKDIYKHENPKSKEAYDTAVKNGIAGGTNRSSVYWKPFPVTWAGGEGVYATTVDGKTVVDFLGNWTAGLFGFSPKEVKDAVVECMENGHALGGANNKYEAIVAKEISRRFHTSIEELKFAMTGTEANTYAINTARAVSGKQKVMMYHGSYHGGYIHGASNVDMEMEIPYDKILVDCGDLDTILKAIEDNANELACFILEPVLINPFMYIKRVAPKEYLQAIRDQCTKFDVCLIFDEVMTSRLSPGGAQDLVGVYPDMTTMGKYLGGGFPFACFGGKKRWMARHNPNHKKSIASGGTFNQNALSMAAAAAVVTKIWTSENCLKHNQRGEWFKGQINSLSKKYGSPVHAVGTGSLISLVWQNQNVIDGNGQLNQVIHPAVFHMPTLFWYYMFVEKNILAGSPKLNYLTLPMYLKDEHYAQFLDGMEDFFKTYSTEMKLLIQETGTSQRSHL